MIKWNQVCASVHEVMKEILLGLEMGSINQDTYNRFKNIFLTFLSTYWSVIVFSARDTLLKGEEGNKKSVKVREKK